MEYRFALAGGYEDVASGRVLLHRSGQPPFPARLALELFGRARDLAPKKEGSAPTIFPCWRAAKKRRYPRPSPSWWKPCTAIPPNGS